MSVTVAEFQSNLREYLALAEKEQVAISDGKKTIAVLSSPNRDRVETARSLFGILPPEASLGDALEERLSKI